MFLERSYQFLEHALPFLEQGAQKWNVPKKTNDGKSEKFAAKYEF